MAEQNRISTDELMRLLLADQSLDHFLQRDASAFLTPTFGAYLSGWCREHGTVPAQLIKSANLEASFGHQLFSGRRNPSRDTVLQLAIAMKAGIGQTQEMLKIARKSMLYPRIKRDAAILYCLHHHLKLIDVEIILQDLELPLLGGGKHE